MLGNVDGDEDPRKSLKPFRQAFEGVFIAAGGYVPDTGSQAIKDGHADAIAFGRWHLANPDFVRRAKLGAPLNKYDRATFYTQGEEGYIDYPFLEDTEWGKEHKEEIEEVL